MGEKAEQPVVRKPHDGIIRRQVDIDIRSIDKETRSFDMIASSASLDSHGDVVEQNFKLDRYKKNPVVLWNHNAFGFLDGSRPEDFLSIGKSSKIRVEDGMFQVRMSLVDGTEEEEPLVNKIWRRVQQGMQRASSIGFRPGKVSVEETPGGGEIYHLDENEIYEISLVPMGSNPDAVAKMVSEGDRAWLKSVASGATIIGNVSRGVVPYYAYPPNDGSEGWDANAAAERMRKWASKDGSGAPETIDWARYRNGFAWFNSAEPENLESYKLPHHDVLNGGLVTVKPGVVAAGNAVQGARGGAGVPNEDVPEVKKHLEKHYEQFQMVAPWHKAAGALEITKIERGDQEKMDIEALKAELAKAEKALTDERVAKGIADEKVKMADARATASETKATGLEAQLLTEKTVSAQLTVELKAAGSRAEAAEAELCDSVIEKFVGPKITPAEKAGYVELALGVKADETKGVKGMSGIGLERVKSMLVARPDLSLTKGVTAGGKGVGDEKPAPAPVEGADTAEGASASLVSDVNKSVEARAN